MRWPVPRPIWLLPLLTFPVALAQTPEERPRPALELAPVPPSFVELVLQQILVERDLDTARKMLVEHLPKALNDHQNSEWTARVYALLAAVASLGGEEVQARKLALRAVTLNEAVSLEPQLGDVAQKVLTDARLEWRSRPATAVLEVAPLPIGLELWVDGGPLLLPAREPLRPGDHLLQVVSRQGVVARGWVLLKSGETLQEPPPLPEVRRTLEAPPTLESVPVEEVSRLAQEAAKAEADIRQVADALELEHSLARASRYTERALCLAEVEHQLQRLTEELEGFKLRLQQAMLRDRADEIRHLFQMIRLTRDEALRLQVEQEACLDQVQRGADQELRVTQSPGQAKAMPPLEAQPLDGLHALSRTVRAESLIAFHPPKPRFELSRGAQHRPTASAREPAGADVATPSAAPGADAATASSATSSARQGVGVPVEQDLLELRTDIWVEGASRFTQDADTSLSALGMRVTPAIQLKSPHVSAEAMWSVGLFQLNRLEDYALRMEGGGLPAPGKQERPWALQLSVGQQVPELRLLLPTSATLERSWQQLGWARYATPLSSVETHQRVDFLRERLDFSALTEHNLTETPRADSSEPIRQERLSLSGEVGGRWKVYPYSHVLADAAGQLAYFPAAGVLEDASETTQPGLPSPGNVSSLRVRVGVEGLLAPQLTARFLPSWTHVQGWDADWQPVESGSAWDGVGGALQLTLGPPRQRLQLQLVRQLSAESYVHRLLHQGVGLQLELRPTSTWALLGEAELGQEQGRWLQTTSASTAYFLPAEYEQLVWHVKGEAQLQPFRELPLWLTFRYVAGSRGTATLESAELSSRSWTPYTEHQLFLGGVARY